MSLLSKVFGDANVRNVRSLQPTVASINALEKRYEGLSDDHLRQLTATFRTQLQKKEKSLDEILPDAFAMVREAAKRTLQQRHFDVQLIGGIVLHQGKIAEMKTGEGKTLTATSALFLNALSGQGAHLVTVNDYLAKRDSVWMGQIYHFLGLSVGCIQHEAAFVFEPNPEQPWDDVIKHLRPVSRQEAYAADITYGTNNEFGFDYLRDNMVQDMGERVQRGHHFAIVDEVDSILIDEARTPLIISAPSEKPAERYYQFANLVAQLTEGEDYNVDEKMRASTMTDVGITKIEKWLGVKNLYQDEGIETVHHLESALKARALFQKDKDYVVKDGEVVIVDEFTGRLMIGRRYSEGLHQAIEAKERVQIKEESITLATITFQNYFRMYDKLSGMTGTAATEAEEFSKIYSLDTVIIPTNRPMVREDLTDRVYKTERGKFKAIVEHVRGLHEKGQPVLMGTISIEKNELLSGLLDDAGIPHEVLNAKNHEREAKIIAQAGRKGAVTLATNIAGRGVDIILGGTPLNFEEAEEVKRAGGLFVLGTERHEARRIDNQLRGRSGRQGDPGASQFFVSLEDDLLRVFGSEKMRAVMHRLGLPEDMPIENGMVSKAIETAQHRVEGHNFDIRKHLVEYDDVMNKHREVIYARRESVLTTSGQNTRLRVQIEKMIEAEIERVVTFHTAAEEEENWDINEIYEVIATIFPVDLHSRLKLEDFREGDGGKLGQAQSREAIIKHLIGLSKKAYDQLEEVVGDPVIMGNVERSLLLRSLDSLWIEHLEQMDYLRHGIGLRGYGQRDPLVEYKREAYAMFQQLNASIDQQVVNAIFKLGQAKAIVAGGMPKQQIYRAPDESTTAFSGMPEQGESGTSSVAPSIEVPKTPEGKKLGRNDLCWCGSGKKYKKCHGK